MIKLHWEKGKTTKRRTIKTPYLKMFNIRAKEQKQDIIKNKSSLIVDKSK
jgi:hypothetical protein